MDWSTSHAAERLADAVSRFGLIPPDRTRVSLPDLLQNALLLLPFGVCGAIALRRQFVSALPRLVLVAVAALCVSVAAEAAQLFTTDRVSSWSDVIMQTAGACVAAAGALLFETSAARRQHTLAVSAWTSSSIFFPAVLALAVVVGAAWAPFDVSLDAGAAWHKVKALRVDPWQGGVVSDEPLQFLRYAAFAIIVGTWLSERRVAGASMIAGGVASILGVALEASQLVFDSHMPGLRDALVAVGGAGCGALAFATMSAPIRRHSALLVVAGSWIGGAVMMTSPFDFSSEAHGINWLPFRSFVDSTPLVTLQHVCDLALLHVPIGVALSRGTASPTRTRDDLRRLTALAMTGSALIQLTLEACQTFVPGRYADVSDIVLAAAFGLGGAMLAATLDSDVNWATVESRRDLRVDR